MSIVIKVLSAEKSFSKSDEVLRSAPSKKKRMAAYQNSIDPELQGSKKHEIHVQVRSSHTRSNCDNMLPQ